MTALAPPVVKVTEYMALMWYNFVGFCHSFACSQYRATISRPGRDVRLPHPRGVERERRPSGSRRQGVSIRGPSINLSSMSKL